MKLRIRLSNKLKNDFIFHKENAKARGKDVELPLWYYCAIRQSKVCFYSGEVHDNLTLERIDNSKGYVVGNVIPVCRRLNSIKGSHDVKDMNRFIKQLERKLIDTPAAIAKSENKIKELNDKIMYVGQNSHKKHSHLLKQLKAAYIKRYDAVNRCKYDDWNKRIGELNLLIDATNYWTRLNSFGILLNIFYQEPFNPKEKFK